MRKLCLPPVLRAGPLALLIAAAAAACAPRSAAPADTAAASANAAAPANTPADAPAAALPTLEAARDLDGHAVGALTSEQHATVVVVFASWCGPCRHELALLGELRADEPRVRIVGVNAFEDYDDRSDEQRLRDFLASSAPWLRVVRADEPLMAALGQPSKIPTMYVFDRAGALVHSFRRDRRPPPDRAELSAAVAEVLP
ncbi:TlpA family protein disulfide reductase [Haliangium ochraceum]|uniref:Alkyl hydroperoxide reductase/thiol specific antioxidant/Mal allergen n=1 Tax=Haliangium ochraceum (strain DSM 14365 / JCM 11303 / SMP-2) TaxID=502025 RepID=D0LWK6_HALO1|nr:TlpA disulfide reductase family protein [Haliangium ochraceum]ACY17656.1 alkyl hydroperoxide reductase/thiol specific antioxidant/Mal allergen [Haliangium ochraceum DSM 14365]